MLLGGENKLKVIYLCCSLNSGYGIYRSCTLLCALSSFLSITLTPLTQTHTPHSLSCRDGTVGVISFHDKAQSFSFLWGQGQSRTKRGYRYTQNRCQIRRGAWMHSTSQFIQMNSWDAKCIYSGRISSVICYMGVSTAIFHCWNPEVFPLETTFYTYRWMTVQELKDEKTCLILDSFKTNELETLGCGHGGWGKQDLCKSLTPKSTERNKVVCASLLCTHFHECYMYQLFSFNSTH